MTISANIKPCLWFDGRAEEAANLYVSLFPDSSIGMISRWGDGGPYPAGTALMVEFNLGGQRFQALNGGAARTPSSAVSLSIDCETEAEVDHYWNGLVADGRAGGTLRLADRPLRIFLAGGAARAGRPDVGPRPGAGGPGEPRDDDHDQARPVGHASGGGWRWDWLSVRTSWRSNV